MRRRAALLIILLALAFALTGCNFWDWLAGRPISGSPSAGVGENPSGSGVRDVTRDGEPAGDAGQPGSPAGGGGAGHPDGGETVPPGEDGQEKPPTTPTGPFPEIQIPPDDQASEEPSFRAFHARLRQIVASRDAEALLSVVHPAVKNGFGGEDGIEAFKQKWRLGETPEASPLWLLLGDLLQLGGVFTDEERRTFVAPYVFALFDRYAGQLDPSFHGVVIGEGVNVRAAPGLDAAVLDTVSHLVVRVLPAEGEELPTVELDGRTYTWRKVQLPSGTIGYVADKYLWLVTGYRVGFQREDEDWRLVFLVAGD